MPFQRYQRLEEFVFFTQTSRLTRLVSQFIVALTKTTCNSNFYQTSAQQGLEEGHGGKPGMSKSDIYMVVGLLWSFRWNTRKLNQNQTR